MGIGTVVSNFQPNLPLNERSLESRSRGSEEPGCLTTSMGLQVDLILNLEVTVSKQTAPKAQSVMGSAMGCSTSLILLKMVATSTNFSKLTIEFGQNELPR